MASFGKVLFSSDALGPPELHHLGAVSGYRSLPSTQLQALAELEADTVLTVGLGDLLTRCVLATRRSEYARCVQMGDDAVRAVTFGVF